MMAYAHLTTFFAIIGVTAGVLQYPPHKVNSNLTFTAGHECPSPAAVTLTCGVPLYDLRGTLDFINAAACSQSTSNCTTELRHVLKANPDACWEIAPNSRPTPATMASLVERGVRNAQCSDAPFRTHAVIDKTRFRNGLKPTRSPPICMDLAALTSMYCDVGVDTTLASADQISCDGKCYMFAKQWFMNPKCWDIMHTSQNLTLEQAMDQRKQVLETKCGVQGNDTDDPCAQYTGDQMKQKHCQQALEHVAEYTFTEEDSDVGVADQCLLHVYDSMQSGCRVSNGHIDPETFCHQDCRESLSNLYNNEKCWEYKQSEPTGADPAGTHAAKKFKNAVSHCATPAPEPTMTTGPSPAATTDATHTSSPTHTSPAGECGDLSEKECTEAKALASAMAFESSAGSMIEFEMSATCLGHVHSMILSGCSLGAAGGFDIFAQCQNAKCLASASAAYRSDLCWSVADADSSSKLSAGEVAFSYYSQAAQACAADATTKPTVFPTGLPTSVSTADATSTHTLSTPSPMVTVTQPTAVSTATSEPTLPPNTMCRAVPRDAAVMCQQLTFQSNKMTVMLNPTTCPSETIMAAATACRPDRGDILSGVSDPFNLKQMMCMPACNEALVQLYTTHSCWYFPGRQQTGRISAGELAGVYFNQMVTCPSPSSQPTLPTDEQGICQFSSLAAQTRCVRAVTTLAGLRVETNAGMAVLDLQHSTCLEVAISVHSTQCHVRASETPYMKPYFEERCSIEGCVPRLKMLFKMGRCWRKADGDGLHSSGSGAEIASAIGESISCGSEDVCDTWPREKRSLCRTVKALLGELRAVSEADIAVRVNWADCAEMLGSVYQQCTREVANPLTTAYVRGQCGNDECRAALQKLLEAEKCWSWPLDKKVDAGGAFPAAVDVASSLYADCPQGGPCDVKFPNDADMKAKCKEAQSMFSDFTVESSLPDAKGQARFNIENCLEMATKFMMAGECGLPTDRPVNLDDVGGLCNRQECHASFSHLLTTGRCWNAVRTGTISTTSTSTTDSITRDTLSNLPTRMQLVSGAKIALTLSTGAKCEEDDGEGGDDPDDNEEEPTLCERMYPEDRQDHCKDLMDIASKFTIHSLKDEPFAKFNPECLRELEGLMERETSSDDPCFKEEFVASGRFQFSKDTVPCDGFCRTRYERFFSMSRCWLPMSAPTNTLGRLGNMILDRARNSVSSAVPSIFRTKMATMCASTGGNNNNDNEGDVCQGFDRTSTMYRRCKMVQGLLGQLMVSVGSSKAYFSPACVEPLIKLHSSDCLPEVFGSSRPLNNEQNLVEALGDNICEECFDAAEALFSNAMCWASSAGKVEPDSDSASVAMQAFKQSVQSSCGVATDQFGAVIPFNGSDVNVQLLPSCAPKMLPLLQHGCLLPASSGSRARMLADNGGGEGYKRYVPEDLLAALDAVECNGKCADLLRDAVGSRQCWSVDGRTASSLAAAAVTERYLEQSQESCSLVAPLSSLFDKLTVNSLVPRRTSECVSVFIPLRESCSEDILTGGWKKIASEPMCSRSEEDVWKCGQAVRGMLSHPQCWYAVPMRRTSRSVENNLRRNADRIGRGGATDRADESENAFQPLLSEETFRMPERLDLTVVRRLKAAKEHLQSLCRPDICSRRLTSSERREYGQVKSCMWNGRMVRWRLYDAVCKHDVDASQCFTMCEDISDEKQCNNIAGAGQVCQYDDNNGVCKAKPCSSCGMDMSCCKARRAYDSFVRTPLDERCVLSSTPPGASDSSGEPTVRPAVMYCAVAERREVNSSAVRDIIKGKGGQSGGSDSKKVKIGIRELVRNGELGVLNLGTDRFRGGKGGSSGGEDEEVEEVNIELEGEEGEDEVELGSIELGADCDISAEDDMTDRERVEAVRKCRKEAGEKVSQRLEVKKTLRLRGRSRIGSGSEVRAKDLVVDDDVVVEGSLIVGNTRRSETASSGKGRLIIRGKVEFTARDDEEESDGGQSGSGGEDDTEQGVGRRRRRAEVRIEQDVEIEDNGEAVFGSRGRVSMTRSSVRISRLGKMRVTGSDQVVEGDDDSRIVNNGTMLVDIEDEGEDSGSGSGDTSSRRRRGRAEFKVRLQQRGDMRVAKGDILLSKGVETEGSVHVNKNARLRLAGNSFLRAHMEHDGSSSPGGNSSSSGGAHMFEGVVVAESNAEVVFDSDVDASGQVQVGAGANVRVRGGFRASRRGDSGTEEEKKEQEESIKQSVDESEGNVIVKFFRPHLLKKLDEGTTQLAKRWENATYTYPAEEMLQNLTVADQRWAILEHLGELAEWDSVDKTGMTEDEMEALKDSWVSEKVANISRELKKCSQFVGDATDPSHMFSGRNITDALQWKRAYVDAFVTALNEGVAEATTARGRLQYCASLMEVQKALRSVRDVPRRFRKLFGMSAEVVAEMKDRVLPTMLKKQLDDIPATEKGRMWKALLKLSQWAIDQDIVKQTSAVLVTSAGSIFRVDMRGKVDVEADAVLEGGMQLDGNASLNVRGGAKVKLLSPLIAKWLARDEDAEDESPMSQREGDGRRNKPALNTTGEVSVEDSDVEIDGAEMHGAGQLQVRNANVTFTNSDVTGDNASVVDIPSVLQRRLKKNMAGDWVWEEPDKAEARRAIWRRMQRRFNSTVERAWMRAQKEEGKMWSDMVEFAREKLVAWKLYTMNELQSKPAEWIMKKYYWFVVRRRRMQSAMGDMQKPTSSMPTMEEMKKKLMWHVSADVSLQADIEASLNNIVDSDSDRQEAKRREFLSKLLSNVHRIRAILRRLGFSSVTPTPLPSASPSASASASAVALTSASAVALTSASASASAVALTSASAVASASSAPTNEAQDSQRTRGTDPAGMPGGFAEGPLAEAMAVKGSPSVRVAKICSPMLQAMITAGCPSSQFVISSLCGTTCLQAASTVYMSHTCWMFDNAQSPSVAARDVALAHFRQQQSACSGSDSSSRGLRGSRQRLLDSNSADSSSGESKREHYRLAKEDIMYAARWAREHLAVLLRERKEGMEDSTVTQQDVDTTDLPMEDPFNAVEWINKAGWDLERLHLERLSRSAFVSSGVKSRVRFGAGVRASIGGSVIVEGGIDVEEDSEVNIGAGGHFSGVQGDGGGDEDEDSNSSSGNTEGEEESGQIRGTVRAGHGAVIELNRVNVSSTGELVLRNQSNFAVRPMGGSDDEDSVDPSKTANENAMKLKKWRQDIGSGLRELVAGDGVSTDERDRVRQLRKDRAMQRAQRRRMDWVRQILAEMGKLPEDADVSEDEIVGMVRKWFEEKGISGAKLRDTVREQLRAWYSDSETEQLSGDKLEEAADSTMVEELFVSRERLAQLCWDMMPREPKQMHPSGQKDAALEYLKRIGFEMDDAQAASMLESDVLAACGRVVLVRRALHKFIRREMVEMGTWDVSEDVARNYVRPQEFFVGLNGSMELSAAIMHWRLMAGVHGEASANASTSNVAEAEMGRMDHALVRFYRRVRHLYTAVTGDELPRGPMDVLPAPSQASAPDVSVPANATDIEKFMAKFDFKRLQKVDRHRAVSRLYVILKTLREYRSAFSPLQLDSNSSMNVTMGASVSLKGVMDLSGRVNASSNSEMHIDNSPTSEAKPRKPLGKRTGEEHALTDSDAVKELLEGGLVDVDEEAAREHARRERLKRWWMQHKPSDNADDDTKRRMWEEYMSKSKDLGSKVETMGGHISGNGVLPGLEVAILNRSSIAPGNSPGSLHIDGDFNMDDSSTLVIEMAGTNEGEYDSISVGGNANVRGQVEGIAIDGYEPAESDSINFLQASQVSGGFRSVSGDGAENLMVSSSSGSMKAADVGSPGGGSNPPGGNPPGGNSPNDDGSGGGGGLGTGALIAIAAGCAIIVGFVGYAVMLQRRKKTRSQKDDSRDMKNYTTRRNTNAWTEGTPENKKFTNPLHGDSARRSQAPSTTRQ